MAEDNKKMPQAFQVIKPKVLNNEYCHCGEIGANGTTEHSVLVVGYFLTATLYQRFDFYATATCENHKQNYITGLRGEFVTPKEFKEKYEVIGSY